MKKYKSRKVEKASRWQGKKDEKKQKVHTHTHTHTHTLTHSIKHQASRKNQVHKVKVHKNQGKIRQMRHLQLMLPAPMIEFGQMELEIDFDLQSEHWSYQMPRIYI